MRAFTFRDEFTYRGHKATTLVELVRPWVRTVLKVEMSLDTGAEISVLNRMFLRQLRLNVTDGSSATLTVANGDTAQAYIHPVEIRFLGRQMTVQVAICPDWDTENLLGMQGFFDQMVVAFDHAQWRIYV